MSRRWFMGDVLNCAWRMQAVINRFSGVPPYAETQVFVERVGILLERYRTQLAAAARPVSQG